MSLALFAAVVRGGACASTLACKDSCCCCRGGSWEGVFPLAFAAGSNHGMSIALAAVGSGCRGALLESRNTAGEGRWVGATVLGCKKVVGGGGVHDKGGRAGATVLGCKMVVGGGGVHDKGGRAGATVLGCKMVVGGGGVHDKGGRAGGAAVAIGGWPPARGVPRWEDSALRGRFGITAAPDAVVA